MYCHIQCLCSTLFRCKHLVFMPKNSLSSSSCMLRMLHGSPWSHTNRCMYLERLLARLLGVLGHETEDGDDLGDVHQCHEYVGVLADPRPRVLVRGVDHVHAHGIATAATQQSLPLAPATPPRAVDRGWARARLNGGGGGGGGGGGETGQGRRQETRDRRLERRRDVKDKRWRETGR